MRDPFRLKTTCAECPWRRDVPTGRFPPERFERLRTTCEQAFGPYFSCHKSTNDAPAICVGYLLVDGQNNFRVRLAQVRREFDPRGLRAEGPLYASYEEMAEANGTPWPRRRRGERVRARR